MESVVRRSGQPVPPLDSGAFCTRLYSPTRSCGPSQQISCYQAHLTHFSVGRPLVWLLMEAAGAVWPCCDALVMAIRLFIKRGWNGFLVPYSETVPEEQLWKQLVIANQLSSDLAPFHQAFMTWLFLTSLLTSTGSSKETLLGDTSYGKRNIKRNTCSDKKVC